MTTGISTCRLLRSLMACFSSPRSREPGAYARMGSFTGVGILAGVMPGNVTGEPRDVLEVTMTIDPRTRIGHVHLTVSDLDRALHFYRDVLGFEVTSHYGRDAVFVSAGGYHHHIGLNTWA